MNGPVATRSHQFVQFHQDRPVAREAIRNTQVRALLRERAHKHRAECMQVRMVLAALVAAVMFLVMRGNAEGGEMMDVTRVTEVTK